jgi:hypothetical protein
VPSGHIAHAGSPVKEGSYLQRETSASEIEGEGEVPGKKDGVELEQGSEHAKLKPVSIQK